MRFLSTETEVSTPECAFGDERGGARRATPLQLWGSLFTISMFDVIFCGCKRLNKSLRSLFSMPRDRNGSKALIPHGFVVIFYRVVAMKGLCVKITIFVGRRIGISCVHGQTESADLSDSREPGGPRRR